MGTGMKEIRAFIAIELPINGRTYIDQLTQKLRPVTSKNIRWIPSSNIHLTLKFLGESAPQSLELLATTIDQNIKKMTPFDLVLSHLGTFPNARQPRIVWIGFQPNPKLMTLQSCVENAAQQTGFAKEDRPYSPHLTIARVREPLARSEVEQLNVSLQNTSMDTSLVIPVKEVILFRSDLHPSGAIYTIVRRFPL